MGSSFHSFGFPTMLECSLCPETTLLQVRIVKLCLMNLFENFHLTHIICSQRQLIVSHKTFLFSCNFMEHINVYFMFYGGLFFKPLGIWKHTRKFISLGKKLRTVLLIPIAWHFQESQDIKVSLLGIFKVVILKNNLIGLYFIRIILLTFFDSQWLRFPYQLPIFFGKTSLISYYCILL